MMKCLNIPDGEVLYDANFFSEKESDIFFKNLLNKIDWRQEDILIFGKKVPQPRLIAWHGDRGISYTYSHLQLKTSPWTADLLSIKSKIESSTETSFNSVLLNLYRDGKDSMGWHSDDEPELGPNPSIGSVSFGSLRRFHFRHKFDKQQEKIRIDLGHGSLLWMKGSTQHNWQHSISKTRRKVGPRINLTFRRID